MTSQNVSENIEFLAKYFSAPDKDSLRQIHAGTTPLGAVAGEEPFAVFCDEAAASITQMFVNSRQQRPLYPLASEYVKNKTEVDPLRNELAALFTAEGRAVVGYPPDHITPLLEHTLRLLRDDQPDKAQDFFTTHMQRWTMAFSEAILDRRPQLHIRRVAELLSKIGTSFDEMR